MFREVNAKMFLEKIESLVPIRKTAKEMSGGDMRVTIITIIIKIVTKLSLLSPFENLRFDKVAGGKQFSLHSHFPFQLISKIVDI